MLCISNSSFTSQNDSDTETGTWKVSLTQSPSIKAEAITTNVGGLRFPSSGNIVDDFDGVTATFVVH